MYHLSFTRESGEKTQLPRRSSRAVFRRKSYALAALRRRRAEARRKRTAAGIFSGAAALLPVFLLAVLAAVCGVLFVSCSVLGQGGMLATGLTTYPSADTEMLGAEDAYARMEASLSSLPERYVPQSPCDEVRWDICEPSHDPYVLVSLLTADRCDEWTLEEMAGELERIFRLQYPVTESVTEETRYRTVRYPETVTVTDPETGAQTESTEYRTVSEAYTVRICTVTVRNTDLESVPRRILDEDRLAAYGLYLACLGNRPDLFPAWAAGRQQSWTPDAQSLRDGTFAAMLAEAQKYLGYPYVWGGSSPATSFDCSGFVSWVLNHSGWDVGRLTAQGLYDACAETSLTDPSPGDLVFFTGTYDAGVPVTHVGIYVGNGTMIHCGNPISYASLDTDYYRQHFYAYGRMAEPEGGTE